MTVSSVLAAGTPRPAESDPSEHVRTQFLKRVAHDIASPTGVTMTVLDELATSNTPRPELVAMARRSLRRLMRLSEQLALVAELEGGSLAPALEVVDFRALVKRAVDDATTVDGRKDVSTSYEPPTTPLLIPGDQRLLQIVVREIIGNAIKLACSHVEVTLGIEDGAVALRIDDDGPGFAEDSLATFGQRFVRRSSARGLGLSLSMALEILRDHGGSLTLEQSRLPANRRGSIGASVVVRLPVAH